MATVKGKLWWVYVNRLDTKYNQWSVTIVITTAEAKRLIDMGLNPKPLNPIKDSEEMLEGGQYKISFYRKLFKRGAGAGQKNPAPKCALEKEDGTREWYNDAIGYGSEGIVSFGTYGYGDGQTGADLRGIVITDLIPYESTGSGSVNDEDEDELFGGVSGERAEQNYEDVAEEGDAPKEIEEEKTPPSDEEW